ncbi:MAG TPA: hypothetical protein VIM69_07040 [Opitutaceae bacterium]
MYARLCAWPLLAWAVATVCVATTPDSFSDYSYIRPDGWTRRVDKVTHLLVVGPDQHASAIFIQPKSYKGTAQAWHQALWKRLTTDYKTKGNATEGTRGAFNTTWQAFDRGDGSQRWLCLYTTIGHGQGEGVYFVADAEGPFRSNIAAVNQLVDSIKFDSTTPAPSQPAIMPAAPAPTRIPSNITAIAPSTSPIFPATPDPRGNVNPSTLPPANPFAATTQPSVMELSIEPPRGWAVQHDPKTGITLIRPPNAPNINVAALVIFPAIPYTGTADEFHRHSVETTIRGGRLLEPLTTGRKDGLLFTQIHFLSAKGENMRFLMYTARWASRAQAFAFATVREDLFRQDGPIANAALQRLIVPTEVFAASSTSYSANNSTSSFSNTTTPANPALAINSIYPSSAGPEPESIPVLNYSDPPNFFRGAMRHFAEYTSSQVNFSLCVYPFQPYTGDIKAAFQRTLLRDWIDVQYKEENVAAPPRFTSNTVPGADAVIEAHFQENIVGLFTEHHRILIISGNMAALVDLKGRNAQCWQTAFPSAATMLGSMRVGRRTAPPSISHGPGAQGAALAGLFMGTKAKYLALGVTDFTGHAPALHYFLFSPDGRVVRCYDFPPGGSEEAARHFDFDTAERQDPRNSGRFAMRGNELYIKWGGPIADEITTTVTDANNLTLDSVRYVRKW